MKSSDEFTPVKLGNAMTIFCAHFIRAFSLTPF